MAKKKSSYVKRPLWQWLIFSIIIVGLICTVLYYVPNQNTKKNSSDSVYQSILGYSFEYSKNLAVKEEGCSLEELKENPINARPDIKPGDNYSYIYMNDPNKYNAEMYKASIVEYKETINTFSKEQIEEIHQGMLTCLKFFGNYQPIIDEVRTLYETGKTITRPTLGSSPISTSFNLTPYRNEKSGLYGVTFYNIGGYSTLGMRKSKVFYLLSKDNKYFIELFYNIPDSACKTLIAIEAKIEAAQNIPGGYNTAKTDIIQALPECNKGDLPQKNSAMLFLNTFKEK